MIWAIADRNRKIDINYMEQIITTTVVTLISGAIGAIIGTYGGALFAAKRQEKHIKELRQVAIKALKIFQKYARNRQTYDVAASEFNNALSIAEKRVFIVALHKLGIPILATPDSKFDIQNIVFEKREIDKDEIEAIISQIQLGHCDQLFYIEPDNYFSENIRLKTLRYIAKRWVREVFGKSKLDRSQNPIVIVYPTNWWLGYTLGERLGIAVLRERISLDEYFDEQGLPKEDSIERLITDIDRGLWDSSFFWDIENYRSVTATSSLNNMISQLLNNSQNSTIHKKER